MGNKTHPKGIRLGYIRDWDSKWFNPKGMPALIEEDFRIRRYLRGRLTLAAVSRIGIERKGKFLRVDIYTARPGVVIGKKGADIDALRGAVEEMSGFKTTVNVLEIKRPEIDAQLVSEGVAMQLEKQVGFRRAMKRSMERAMQGGALGIKVMVAGRLGGAEIARTEWLKEGRVPLQTFRADIDYGFTEARINMGCIGVKVWIFRKEMFKKTDADLMEQVVRLEKDKLEELARQAETAAAAPLLLPVDDPPAPVEVIAEEVMKGFEDETEARRRSAEAEKGRD
jgi:small subunit ribosomal protein S3